MAELFECCFVCCDGDCFTDCDCTDCCGGCDCECNDCCSGCGDALCCCGACCVCLLEDAAIETAFDGHIRSDQQVQNQHGRRRRRKRHQENKPDPGPPPPAVQLISQRPIPWDNPHHNGSVVNAQPAADTNTPWNSSHGNYGAVINAQPTPGNGVQGSGFVEPTNPDSIGVDELEPPPSYDEATKEMAPQSREKQSGEKQSGQTKKETSI